MNNKQQKDLFEINSIDSALTQEVADLISGVKDLTTNICGGDSHPIFPSIHYVGEQTIGELLVLSGDTAYNGEDISGTFPLFFESQNSRYIPNKVERAIQWYCSESKLRDIHPDKEIAVELCLIFLSNLSNAYYQTKSGWKRLLSKELRNQVSNSEDNTYKNIIELLEEGTKKYGPIIEYTKGYTPGQEARRYRLTDTYRNKGVKKYEFQTQHCRNLLSKQYFKQLNIAMNNPIAKNLITLYQKIDLPNINDLKTEAKRLIKEGYITKKGKILTMRNKHSNDYWNDVNKRSFVEDDIELYKRLTENGYIIPSIGEENAGGRVTDSFTLMPSWIRRMVKIDGQSIVECDYSCLHPNLAVAIYGGYNKFITHATISNELEIDEKESKTQHLGFFNISGDGEFNQEKKKYIPSIIHSKIYKWYEKNEPNMILNIILDKRKNGYKSTTKKMFTLEVKIMTEVIQTLNKEGIYAGYVYDALFCTPKQKERVIQVMNEVVLKHKVYTIAK